MADECAPENYQRQSASVGGGRILEPACGIGHFIGYMPEAIQSRSLIGGGANVLVSRLTRKP